MHTLLKLSSALLLRKEENLLWSNIGGNPQLCFIPHTHQPQAGSQWDSLLEQHTGYFRSNGPSVSASTFDKTWVRVLYLSKLYKWEGLQTYQSPFQLAVMNTSPPQPSVLWSLQTSQVLDWSSSEHKTSQDVPKWPTAHLDITQFSLETKTDMERQPLMPKLHTAAAKDRTCEKLWKSSKIASTSLIKIFLQITSSSNGYLMKVSPNMLQAQWCLNLTEA